MKTRERDKKNVYQHQTKFKLATKKANLAIAEMVICL